MVQKRRELDVWIVQGNTVYRKVPYTVVTDWIQEGRLLAEDQVRPAGGDKWHPIGKVPALAAFLPRAEPFRPDDRAEALESVEVGLDWHPGRHGDEDDDVDMIPLIDISLVLLIFFMMTAAVSAGILSPINTPPAHYGPLQIAEGMYWIGLDSKGPSGQVEPGPDGEPVPWYWLGKGEPSLVLRPGQPEEKDRHMTPNSADVTAKLAQELAGVKGKLPIRIRADRDLRFDVVRNLMLDLQRLEARLNKGRPPADRLSFEVLGEVSEAQGK